MLCGTANAEEFTGTVISVHDGDTAQVKKANGEVVTVRFIYCDAPEIGQPHGNEARTFVHNMIAGKTVTVRATGTDDYGRILGEIFVDGKSVNKEVIREGHGWWFYHYHPERELGDLEAEARSRRKGLWAAESPIYPRAWRRGARLVEVNGSTPPDLSSVFIMAIFPNPVGNEDNKETVVLANRTDASVSINGWRLEDNARGVFVLSGSIPARSARTITLNTSLRLDNKGDTVRLYNAQGHVVMIFRYNGSSQGHFILAP